MLLADLSLKVADHQYQLVHDIPATAEALAKQNFFRGKIAAFEDLLELKDELKQWKEEHK